MGKDFSPELKELQAAVLGKKSSSEDLAVAFGKAKRLAETLDKQYGVVLESRNFKKQAKPLFEEKKESEVADFEMDLDPLAYLPEHREETLLSDDGFDDLFTPSKNGKALSEAVNAVKSDLSVLAEDAGAMQDLAKKGAVDEEEANEILVQMVEYLDSAMEKVFAEGDEVGEEEEFFTIYFKKPVTDKQLQGWADSVEGAHGVTTAVMGDDGINVYTNDKDLLKKIVHNIGMKHIEEVPGLDETVEFAKRAGDEMPEPPKEESTDTITEAGDDITGGFAIGTSPEDIIKENAKEKGIELNDAEWEKLNDDFSKIERNAMAFLKAKHGITTRDEGHDSSDDLIGTFWAPKSKAEFLEDHSGSGEPLRTSSGTLNDQMIWKGVSEVGQDLIDVEISFFGIETEDKDLKEDSGKDRFEQKLEANKGAEKSVVQRAAKAANQGSNYDRTIGIAKAVGDTSIVKHVEGLKSIQDELGYKPDGMDQLMDEFGVKLLFRLVMDHDWTKSQIKEVAWGLPLSGLKMYGLDELRSGSAEDEEPKGKVESVNEGLFDDKFEPGDVLELQSKKHGSHYVLVVATDGTGSKGNHFYYVGCDKSGKLIPDANVNSSNMIIVGDAVPKKIGHKKLKKLSADGITWYLTGNKKIDTMKMPNLDGRYDLFDKKAPEWLKKKYLEQEDQNYHSENAEMVNAFVTHLAKGGKPDAFKESVGESLSEESGKVISEFEIKDIGMEHSQYFQGRGTSHSDWDNVYVGIGSNQKEATDDALEALASDDWEVSSELEDEAKKADEKSNILIKMYVRFKDSTDGKPFIDLIDVNSEGDLGEPQGASLHKGAIEASGMNGEDVAEEIISALEDAGYKLSNSDKKELEDAGRRANENELHYHVAIYVKGNGNDKKEDEDISLPSRTSQTGMSGSDQAMVGAIEDVEEGAVDEAENVNQLEFLKNVVLPKLGEIAKKHDSKLLVDWNPDVKGQQGFLNFTVHCWSNFKAEVGPTGKITMEGDKKDLFKLVDQELEKDGPVSYDGSLQADGGDHHAVVGEEFTSADGTVYEKEEEEVTEKVDSDSGIGKALAKEIQAAFKKAGFNVDIGDEYINIQRKDGLNCEFYGQQGEDYAIAHATYEVDGVEKDLDFSLPEDLVDFVETVKKILSGPLPPMGDDDIEEGIDQAYTVNLLVEAEPTLAPPKKWFDKMYKAVHQDSPSYDDAKVRATVGSIWYNNLNPKKRSAVRAREGKKYAPAVNIEVTESLKPLLAPLMEVTNLTSLLVPNDHSMATWMATRLKQYWKKIYGNEIEKMTGLKFKYDFSTGGGPDHGALATVSMNDDKSDVNVQVEFEFEDHDGGALLKEITAYGRGIEKTPVKTVEDIVRLIKSRTKESQTNFPSVEEGLAFLDSILTESEVPSDRQRLDKLIHQRADLSDAQVNAGEGEAFDREIEKLKKEVGKETLPEASKAMGKITGLIPSKNTVEITYDDKIYHYKPKEGQVSHFKVGDTVGMSILDKGFTMKEDGESNLSEAFYGLDSDDEDDTAKTEAFIKKYPELAKQVEKVGTGYKLTPKAEKELKRTYELFTSNETATERMEGTEQKIIKEVQRVIKKARPDFASKFKVRVDFHTQDSYVGDDAGSATITLTLGDQEEEFEPSALYYNGAHDAAQDALLPSGWDWATWFMDDESPLYSESFAEAYEYDQISQALEQFSSTLDESDFDSELTKKLGEFNYDGGDDDDPEGIKKEAYPDTAAFSDLQDNSLAEEEDEPEEGDAFLENSRGKTSLSYNEKHQGNFESEDEAYEALAELMKENKFFPNVWWVSDHGNHHLVSADFYKQYKVESATIGEVKFNPKWTAKDFASIEPTFNDIKAHIDDWMDSYTDSKPPLKLGGLSKKVQKRVVSYMKQHGYPASDVNFSGGTTGFKDESSKKDRVKEIQSKLKKCAKCGAALHPVYLKNGICNACRNPDSVVTAVVNKKTEGVTESDSTDMHKDLASTLLADALMNEVEQSYPTLEKELGGPGVELTDSMKSVAEEYGINIDEYLPLKLVKSIETDANNKWKGKLTVKELYDHSRNAAHGLVLMAIGHGVAPDDDQEVAEWLKAKGVDVHELGHHENDHDTGAALADAMAEARSLGRHEDMEATFDPMAEDEREHDDETDVNDGNIVKHDIEIR